jgi:hypothetical protein
VHQISGTPFPARSVNDILEHIDNEWGKPGADHDVLEAKRWLLQSEFTNLEIDHRRRRDQTPSPEIKALRAKLSEAFENEDAALESLRTTKPNSVGGVAALLDYVSSDAFPDYDYAAGDVRELIELAATSLRGITATAS